MNEIPKLSDQFNLDGNGGFLAIGLLMSVSPIFFGGGYLFSLFGLGISYWAYSQAKQQYESNLERYRKRLKEEKAEVKNKKNRSGDVNEFINLIKRGGDKTTALEALRKIDSKGKPEALYQLCDYLVNTLSEDELKSKGFAVLTMFGTGDNRRKAIRGEMSSHLLRDYVERWYEWAPEDWESNYKGALSEAYGKMDKLKDLYAHGHYVERGSIEPKDLLVIDIATCLSQVGLAPSNRVSRTINGYLVSLDCAKARITPEYENGRLTAKHYMRVKSSELQKQNNSDPSGINKLRTEVSGADSFLNGLMDVFSGSGTVNSSSKTIASEDGFQKVLGVADGGGLHAYSDEKSLITIAGPGSGKTQCHVLPNLNRFKGAAIVLDVKGECFEHSAEWRREHVGPVFSFSPSDPKVSQKYNPLELLPEDPDDLWEEAKFLAALLVVTKSKSDAIWEDQGRELLALFLACVGMLPPEQRSMTQVLDLMAGIGLEEAFDSILSGEADFPSVMRRTAKKFADIKASSEKQWAGITSAANQHLAVWEGSKVEKVTSASDWTPTDFRKTPAPTLYLQVPPNAIDTYAPLLRVIIAQHVNELMREEPEGEAPPILFMLDEMPQLGLMEPIKKALAVGRSYKIQLWMFAQNLGQIQEVYGKEAAATMVESCGVEMYMNPRQETAERLSKALGVRENVLSGKTEPVVTAQTLTGPEWKDDILVFATGEKPLRLKKAFFHEQLD